MKEVRTAKLILITLIFVAFLALVTWWLLFRPGPPLNTQDPVENFNYGSIGNEETNGLPYWIWRVLPVVFPDYLPGNQDGYASLGLFWESGRELPVGFSQRSVGVIPRVVFNCAFCHQGSYRLIGEHRSTLVPGGAGNRVQPQAYQRFLLRAGRDDRFNADRIMSEIARIYAMPWWEKALYRYLLIPFTRKALTENAAAFAWMDTKPDWGVGRIDPFNPVKFGILELPVDETIGNSDMMPLWALQQVIDRADRVYALHWDGLNTDLHEVVVAGAIGDGMTYKSYTTVYDSIRQRQDWIRLQQPPRSPFSSNRPPYDPYYIAAAEVERGRQIYQAECADCHNPGGARFRSVIPVLEVATDRHRVDMWTKPARDRYNNYEQGSAEWNFSHWQKIEGYVATEFTGLWLKGPYLHNGSVPTLAALLESAPRRPQVFCRGSDTIDPENGGFLAPPNKENCDGFYFDTQVPGNGNQGHEYGTGLPPEQKSALLSYLKTL